LCEFYFYLHVFAYEETHSTYRMLELLLLQYS